MRKFYKRISLLAISLIINQYISAQCGTVVAGGSASNLFTQIRNATNPVAADKDLNTIVFIHRNNANVFVSNSGNLRYDISTNAGTTWTLDQGLLNPVNSSLARYPNIAIYNPSLNVNPSNAYLGYLAATINSVSSAWNGCVSGVRQLSGVGNTENYNQPVVNPQLIPHSVVKGAPGTYWAVDALFNGVNITGFTIYKGVWNGSNDIVWANNFSVTPSFNTAFSNIPQVGDYNIAFDPSGTFGWMSFLSHVSPGPANYALYPVFYKTTNGGATWTGPIQVNLNQFSCLTSNMTASNVPTTNFEHDLAVDASGNPHLFTTICNGSNAYGVLYGTWHHMYDITLKNGLWVAYDVANVNAGRATWGVSPNAAIQDMSPQIARTADGTKLFYTWTDNSTYTLGTSNQSPNLFSRSYNVTANTWTGIKDFSSCNVSASGKILFPHLAPEVLEPSANTFKLASVYGEFTVAGDPLQPCNFNFLNNTTFVSADYTVVPPPQAVSIQQGNNLLLCPNSTLIINVSGQPGQVLWSNGATTSTLAISSNTTNVYTATAQVGCNVGTASITVTNLTLTASAQSPSICPGNSIALSVIGNANGYTWTPGGLTGMNVVVNPTANPIYSVTAGGSSGCTTTNTVGINILPLPNLIISGNNTICIGSLLTQTVSGAFSYTWNNGSTNPTFTATPVVNTSYTVTGVDVNSCVNTQTVDVFINPLPTLTAVSSQSSVCSGGSLNLGATGATTYSWNAVSGNSVIVITPSVSSIYTVSGSDANLCVNSQTVSVLVHPLPQILVVGTKSLICKGEKNTLTASGAASYTWNATSPIVTPTILVSPTITTVYTITATSSLSCINTATYSQLVSACVSIDKNLMENAGFVVYPNPSDGLFSITSKYRVENAIIEVYNNLGQQILKEKILSENQKIDLNSQPNGIYLIYFKVDELLLNKIKLVKQN